MWVRRSEQEIAELRRPRWRWGWPLVAAVGLTSWLHDKTPFSSWELFLVLFPGFVLLARHFRVCAEPLLFNAYFTDDGDLVHYCAECRHIQSLDGEPRCAQCHGPTEPLEHYRWVPDEGPQPATADPVLSEPECDSTVSCSARRPRPRLGEQGPLD
ncbi:MAG: hypothetical protein JSR82_08455 [Verrucomicrobia bacterium]|nr:hypothetical protein [Verrucomicrobiota bacterium]